MATIAKECNWIHVCGEGEPFLKFYDLFSKICIFCFKFMKIYQVSALSSSLRTIDASTWQLDLSKGLSICHFPDLSCGVISLKWRTRHWLCQRDGCYIIFWSNCMLLWHWCQSHSFLERIRLT